MAPNLANSQRRMIYDMILSNELTAAQMADAAGCSVRAVKYTVSAPTCAPLDLLKRYGTVADALDL
jgi:predicted transcriptional regulator